MIYKKINKKAASQLEIIISFAVFIIFLSLVFIIIRPSRVSNDLAVLSENLNTGLVKEATSSLIVTNIAAPQGGNWNGDCISIDNSKIISGGADIPVVAKNKDSAKKPAFVSSNVLYIDRDETQVEDFFSLYYEEDLSESSFSTSINCLDTTPEVEDINNDVSIGLVKNLSFISLKKIEELKARVDQESSYQMLKTQFGIPDSNGFKFVFSSSNREKIFETVDRNTGSGEVYAHEFPVSYIDQEANIKQGWMNVQVW